MLDKEGAILIRAIVALIASVALGVLTYAVVMDGAPTAFDLAAVTWIHAHDSAAALSLMQWASASGGPSITSGYTAILVIVWLVRRQFTTAAAVAAIVYGGSGLNIALKHLVQRGRPIVEDPLVSLSTYSYPSGHAAAATVFGGLLIMLMLRNRPQGQANPLAMGAAGLWIIGVCASRIYLGAHYATDVLAGLLEGIVWLICGSVALDRWHVPLNWARAAAHPS